jgi:putative Mn2+ efflux pump MntP
VLGGLERSAFQAEKRLKLITIVVTGLVERLRAKHVGFSLKISVIKAKIVLSYCTIVTIILYMTNLNHLYDVTRNQILVYSMVR